jgi:hypothetical protein
MLYQYSVIFFFQEEVPPLTSDSEPDDEYVHNGKLRSQSVSRVSASTSHLDSNKVFSYFVIGIHVVVS